MDSSSSMWVMPEELALEKIRWSSEAKRWTGCLKQSRWCFWGVCFLVALFDWLVYFIYVVLQSMDFFCFLYSCILWYSMYWICSFVFVYSVVYLLSQMYFHFVYLQNLQFVQELFTCWFGHTSSHWYRKILFIGFSVSKDISKALQKKFTHGIVLLLSHESHQKDPITI